MTVQKFPQQEKPKRLVTPFREFESYENGRQRALRFDVNALADFEQETGMGFGQLMRMRALFATARAMLWAGLKWQDRALTIERVGELLHDYMSDREVEPGSHTVDAILTVAISAAIDQGALGIVKKEDEDVQYTTTTPGGPDPNALPPVLDVEPIPEPETTTEPTKH